MWNYEFHIFTNASFVNKKELDGDSGEPSKVFIVLGEEIEVKKRGCSIFTLQPFFIYPSFQYFVPTFDNLNESYCTHLMLLLCYFVLLPQAIAWEKFSPKFLPI